MFVRKLNKDEWQSLKALRLEAVELHERFFGCSHAAEAAQGDAYWQESAAADRHAFFGLFDGTEMVGLTAAFTDRADASGRTALLGASYIRDGYSGRGLSLLLYEARIDWAKAQDRFDRILVGHRDGNEKSRRAKQAFGFAKIGAERKIFGDGTEGINHVYEMKLT